MKSRYLPQVNAPRIRKFAEYARRLFAPALPNFYSREDPVSGNAIAEDENYPPLHATGVIDFFFFSALHYYGFWTHKGETYEAPLHVTWEKKRISGPELLYKLCMRAWRKDHNLFHPARLATISESDFKWIFHNIYPSGAQPFSTFERLCLTQEYGRFFVRSVRRGVLTSHLPEVLVNKANHSADPVGELRRILTNPENGVPGFREDPLGRKAELLIMSLVNRPERFLYAGQEMGKGRPMVDHHDMRFALRLGHITLPKSWVKENEERRFTSYEREGAIRYATYRADELAMKESGLTRDHLDGLKRSARRYCTEMETPVCGGCAFGPVCAKKIRRFQPVFRTTFY